MLSAEMKDEHGNKVQKLSEDEIVAQCFTFILAGYETTSNALAFTSYLLALNPDKQEKVFEEIDIMYDGEVCILPFCCLCSIVIFIIFIISSIISVLLF